MNNKWVNDILRHSLSPTLKHHDFQKRGNLYVRCRGSLLHMIDVQGSLWNTENEKSFTLNCGIYAPGVTSQLGNHPEPKHPKVVDCCISARAGMLTSSRLDIWWTVSSSAGAEITARIQKEIEVIVLGTILPFLDQFETELEVAQFLMKKPTRDEPVHPRAESIRLVYAAVLWRRLNVPDKCRACLTELRRLGTKSPSGHLLEEFTQRWNCE